MAKLDLIQKWRWLMGYNVLLITKGAYPNLNANSKIAYEIGNGLKNYYNCNVKILSVINNKSELVSSNPYGIEMVKFDSMIDYHEVMGIRNRKAFKLFKLLFTHRTASIYVRYKRYGLIKVLRDEYIYYLKKELKKEHYDCVIGFYDPEIIADTLYNVSGKIKTIFYMLDPWSTRYKDTEKIENTRKKEETFVDKFDYIFSSDLIFDDFKRVLHASEDVLNKFVTVGYPNICKPRSIETIHEKFDKKHIHCVFLGKLYKDIRSSDYTIAIFERLLNINVVFHIFGFLDRTTESLPNNVIFHGNIPHNELELYINSADFLVNIGNSVSNSMPSKILTYISTGKPIINFVKINNCPTLKYISRYELGLNVYEKEVVSDDDISNIITFINKSIGKKIPFEEVEKRFYDCTPRYVSGKVYDVINQK